MAGKKSASWQLVAVLQGRKTTQKRRRTTQSQHKIKGKNRLNGECNFLVAVVIETFSRYDIYIYIYIRFRIDIFGDFGRQETPYLNLNQISVIRFVLAEDINKSKVSS